MKKILLFSLFLLMLVSATKAQTISVPNFAVASHPFLVNKVVYQKDAFVIELTIENQTNNGYFCASKQIYLQGRQLKKKLYMSRSEGIPVCPDVYRFKWKGEKLTFKLYFPPLDTHVRYVDVIESCQEHCFSIFGLILDRKINDAINHGYDAFDNGDYQRAFQDFKNAINGNPAYPYGFLYANIIKVLMAQKKNEEARHWYNKLLNSNFMDKKAILHQISQEDYFDEMIR